MEKVKPKEASNKAQLLAGAREIFKSKNPLVQQACCLHDKALDLENSGSALYGSKVWLIYLTSLSSLISILDPPLQNTFPYPPNPSLSCLISPCPQLKPVSPGSLGLPVMRTSTDGYQRLNETVLSVSPHWKDNVHLIGLWRSRCTVSISINTFRAQWTKTDGEIPHWPNILKSSLFIRITELPESGLRLHARQQSHCRSCCL
jgi:hypothetical protein